MTAPQATAPGNGTMPVMAPARLIALGCLGISAAALLGALYMEFVYGLAPCILCLYQRIPWVIVAILAAFAFQPALSPDLRRMIIAACGLAFATNALLGGYHVGVEQLWWEGTSACGGAPSSGGPPSLAEIQQAMVNPNSMPRCDEPGWALFGITMAGYNMMLSAALAAVIGFAVRRTDIWTPKSAS